MSALPQSTPQQTVTLETHHGSQDLIIAKDGEILRRSDAHNQILAPPMRVVSNSTTIASQQKVHVVNMADGRLQVRGLLPGQQLLQMPSGKLHICNVSPTTENATAIKVPPSTAPVSSSRLAAATQSIKVFGARQDSEHRRADVCTQKPAVKLYDESGKANEPPGLDPKKASVEGPLEGVMIPGQNDVIEVVKHEIIEDPAEEANVVNANVEACPTETRPGIQVRNLDQMIMARPQASQEVSDDNLKKRKFEDDSQKVNNQEYRDANNISNTNFDEESANPNLLPVESKATCKENNDLKVFTKSLMDEIQQANQDYDLAVAKSRAKENHLKDLLGESEKEVERFRKENRQLRERVRELEYSLLILKQNNPA
eukprot:TRINITY_DN5417_c0_g1_i7.p1 TRINITY_DN5417_c0_g1~~TRINITY_DN5417_c0_g1_i7.p1  ORF type:complete len:371 (-),score=77.64 TRINITY_DN5417_c0_g1_i7:253-1365(-)